MKMKWKGLFQHTLITMNLPRVKTPYNLDAPLAEETQAVPSSVIQSHTLNFNVFIITSSLLLFAIYAYFFFHSLADYWFNPLYTTDDGLQQLFPLYEAVYPGSFAGDIIYTSMAAYLAPLHYWISYGITLLTRDPNLTGHWVMLIQFSLAVSFLFFAVLRLSSLPIALFSIWWFLHTQGLIQRMTLGLPRGWAGMLIPVYFYFVFSKNHWGVIITLFVGTLLNPPATFLIAFAYGLFLFYSLFGGEDRSAIKRDFLRFLLIAPFLFGVAYVTLQRPPEIGTMVDLKTARSMFAFSRSIGRFPFLPFKSPFVEFSTVGMQAFVNGRHHAPAFIEQNILFLVGGTFLFLLAYQVRKKVLLFPSELLTFLIAIISVYFLSRTFAFKLYVPDRHLHYPLNLLMIVGFPLAISRLFQVPARMGFSTLDLRSVALLVFLLAFIFFSGGSGLRGNAYFNIRTDMYGGLYPFIHQNTPQAALIAGHPTHLDGVQLLGLRRGYVTTETAHPFYDRYYAEMLRRLKIVFRAYYSQNAQEFLQALGNEKIDYFVFRNRDFETKSLTRARSDNLLKNWERHLVPHYPPQSYFFRRLSLNPATVYQDSQSTVVDVNKLREETQ